MRLSDWSAACGDGAPDCPEDAEAAEAAEAEPDEAPSGVFVVCDCGISRRIAVDEDGLCASCGAFPIMAADLGSAEAASDLIEDGETATDRAEAAEQRAAAAEAEVVRVRAERELAQVDACLMLALVWAIDAPGIVGACSANGMSTAETDALRGLCRSTIAADRPGDLIAAIRRVLHHEGTAVRGSAACVAAVAAGLPAEVTDA